MEHGQEIVFNEDKTISSIKTYKSGKKDGMSIFFNKDGTIWKESKFINSREFTVNRKDNESYVSNGFLNGHFIQKNYKTGGKLMEGDYWNGFRTGVWINYHKDGGYTKTYYPTEKKELINQCIYSNGLKSERYDKDGNLKSSR